MMARIAKNYGTYRLSLTKASKDLQSLIFNEKVTVPQ